MSKRLIAVVLVMCSAFLASCGTSPTGSELSYISWSQVNIQNSTLADAAEDAINICLRGATSQENLERATRWSTRSVLTWLRVLKSVDKNVSGNIRYTCNSPDLTWVLKTGEGVSNASPSRVNIYMTRPYGTWTHELGHALAALGDTYLDRTAGNCRSGHPESLMCWGAYGPRRDPEQFSTLWQDDIDGIKENYRRLFGTGMESPAWGAGFDHTIPLDSNEPWEGYDIANCSKCEMVDTQVRIDQSKHEEVDPQSAYLDF
jgi:hypothetical protein